MLSLVTCCYCLLRLSAVVVIMLVWLGYGFQSKFESWLGYGFQSKFESTYLPMNTIRLEPWSCHCDGLHLTINCIVMDIVPRKCLAVLSYAVLPSILGRPSIPAKILWNSSIHFSVLSCTDTVTVSHPTTILSSGGVRAWQQRYWFCEIASIMRQPVGRSAFSESFAHTS